MLWHLAWGAVHQLSEAQYLVDITGRPGYIERTRAVFTQGVARLIQPRTPHDAAQPIDGNMPQHHRRASLVFGAVERQLLATGRGTAQYQHGAQQRAVQPAAIEGCEVISVHRGYAWRSGLKKRPYCEAHEVQS